MACYGASRCSAAYLFQDLQCRVKHALFAVLIPALSQKPRVLKAKALSTRWKEYIPLHLQCSSRFTCCRVTCLEPAVLVLTCCMLLETQQASRVPVL